MNLNSGVASFAIQGERGSNSHLAARAMLGTAPEIRPFALSAEVVTALLSGNVDAAVLPIENSLHGSVAEHYDLLLANDLRIDGEYLLRVEHNLIGYPGVPLSEVRTVLSHPVALSQCRKFLGGFQQARAVPFYDTAGSVRHLMAEHLRDTAAIAPRLAGELYGGQVLLWNLEDHAENFTRFHLLRRGDADPSAETTGADKMSVAFALEHRPGSLATALRGLADVGADLTKIESRPVPGRPWEYVFFVDLRFREERVAQESLATLEQHSRMLRELGRYRAA